MRFIFDPAMTLPAALMSDNLLRVVINGHGGRVGFDGKFFTDAPGRRRIGVAVEADRKVFMHL